MRTRDVIASSPDWLRATGTRTALPGSGSLDNTGNTAGSEDRRRRRGRIRSLVDKCCVRLFTDGATGHCDDTAKVDGGDDDDDDNDDSVGAESPDDVTSNDSSEFDE